METGDPDLAALPDEDFRFTLGIREGDSAEFFGPSDDREELLAERRDWLRKDPARYAAVTANSGPYLAEVESLARSWGFAPDRTSADELERMASLGRQIEPDLVLLAPDSGADGRGCRLRLFSLLLAIDR